MYLLKIVKTNFSDVNYLRSYVVLKYNISPKFRMTRKKYILDNKKDSLLMKYNLYILQYFKKILYIFLNIRNKLILISHKYSHHRSYEKKIM